MQMVFREWVLEKSGLKGSVAASLASVLVHSAEASCQVVKTPVASAAQEQTSQKEIHLTQ